MAFLHHVQRLFGKLRQQNAMEETNPLSEGSWEQTLQTSLQLRGRWPWPACLARLEPWINLAASMWFLQNLGLQLLHTVDPAAYVDDMICIRDV